MRDLVLQILRKLSEEVADREKEISRLRFGTDIYSMARSQGFLDGLDHAIEVVRGQVEDPEDLLD